nr:PREDICTED: potassium channel subfamily K member 7 [Latimeria chalumnae]|eukprot:XP_014349148.1 PREDICTED: potassium channel subfamily K member 7 [Latimeria chalumnae]
MVRSSSASHSMKAWCYCLLLGAYALYLLIGTLVFWGIERDSEVQLQEELRALKQTFLGDNRCLSEENLEEFLEHVLTANKYKVSALQDRLEEESWDFSSSFFFVSTVITTTGYGHTVPLSDGGKVFCIIFSLFGIPLSLFLFRCLVHNLMTLVTRRPVHYIHTRWGYARNHVALLHAFVLSFFLLSGFFLIPAICFMLTERHWNFLESIYFCFISLSTIGLGDYIPGMSTSPSLRQIRYIILGLIVMLLLLETFYELQEVHYIQKLFSLPKEKQEEDQLHVLQHDELALESTASPLPRTPTEDKTPNTDLPPLYKMEDDLHSH